MNKNTFTLYSKFAPFQWLCFYCFFLLIVKLMLLPFVHAIDADGISRVFLSLQWTNNPHLIKTGNWPPLYFYLMGGALKLYQNQFYTPLFVNIFLSVFTIFPLYFLIKRVFNEKTALLIVLTFSLSPIIFRLSLLSLSETPSIFFIILSANSLAKGLMEKSINYVSLSGLLLTIAGGIRYDSWFIIPLITLFIGHRFSKKEALLFLFTASIFPVYWLASNYHENGNMFNSFTWAIDAIETNKITSIDGLLRRIWFYPLSLVFAFGPIAFYFFIKQVLRIIKNKKTHHNAFLFLILFLIIFVLFLVNCLRGSLLTQHRFTLTLYLFSFYIMAYYFQQTKRPFKMAVLFSLSAFLLAFVYSSKGARPIPRILKTEAILVDKEIKKNITRESGLILDYWDWETTYYIAFMSGLVQQNITIIDQNTIMDAVLNEIESVVFRHSTGCMLISKTSRITNEISIKDDLMILNKSQIRLNIRLILENKEIRLYNYQVIKQE